MQGIAKQGKDRLGRARKELAGQGKTWQGKERLGRQGMAGQGMVLLFCGGTLDRVHQNLEI